MKRIESRIEELEDAIENARKIARRAESRSYHLNPVHGNSEDDLNHGSSLSKNEQAWSIDKLTGKRE
jgi:hypothetical protein